MRIAISGAGVAGTALAHWLHRTGHTPTVIEQAPAFRSGGYMIDFWGVGYTVAQRMGIEAQILDKGYQIESVRSVGADGRIRAALNAGVFKHLLGDDFTSLPRGDLAATIHTTIADHVEMIYGDSITGIDDHDDGVRLTFAHAGPREFDLVIGADGLHSNVRRLVFGPDTDFEHYLGCKVAAAVVEGYRPRDELVYVSYAVPGRQVSRVALRDDPGAVRVPRRLPGGGRPAGAVAPPVHRRGLGVPAAVGRGRRGRRPVLRCGQPGPDGTLVTGAGAVDRRRRRLHLPAGG